MCDCSAGLPVSSRPGTVALPNLSGTGGLPSPSNQSWDVVAMPKQWPPDMLEFVLFIQASASGVSTQGLLPVTQTRLPNSFRI